MDGNNMRLTKTQTILNTRLKNTIRRSYPLIGSQEMQQSYDALTDPGASNLNMTKEPWIEALPKYKPLKASSMASKPVYRQNQNLSNS